MYTKHPVCLNIASTFLYPFFSISTLLLTTTLFGLFPAYYRNVYFIFHYIQNSYFHKLQINSFLKFSPPRPCLSISVEFSFPSSIISPKLCTCWYSQTCVSWNTVQLLLQILSPTSHNRIAFLPFITLLYRPFSAHSRNPLPVFWYQSHNLTHKALFYPVPFPQILYMLNKSTSVVSPHKNLPSVLSTTFCSPFKPHTCTVPILDSHALPKIGFNVCSFKIDVRGSVHHSIIHIENPKSCSSVSKFYFIFVWSSTCFGWHTAHHQEPKLH